MVAFQVEPIRAHDVNEFFQKHLLFHKTKLWPSVNSSGGGNYSLKDASTTFLFLLAQRGSGGT